MEYWLIGNKGALLFYVIAATYFLSGEGGSHELLAFLLYICLNVAIPLFKHRTAKLSLLALSSALIVACADRLSPDFLLLLPVHLFDLMEVLDRKPRGGVILLVLVPIPFLPHSFMPIYILSTFLSVLLYVGLRFQLDRLRRLDQSHEKIRRELDKLSRTLGENEAYLRQSEYTIKLEERNRLSQRIHDEIGHSMAGALIQMEASRRLFDTDRDKAAELLGNAISISKEGLERIRRALKDIKPKSEELGIHRLRLYLDELSAKHNDTFSFALTHEGDLDTVTPIQWKIIQENMVEGITNAMKYSQATAIAVELNVLNRFVKFVVSDNGIGTDKVIKGLGIVGMEERAASVGGTVVVDGTKGFRVTTLLPVNGKA
ncbi:sensor histidine kinase [Cohnella sp. AR92]|uniref:sensor histidine kinase n=1 Tax=Cohnella sp. AR92 TaxID=648716 RepID=UPI000F8D9B5E|nr:sensor histidine kinase [Cohnella sp. AR92]RUS45350.1 sensor histidine kinase [Cohnella sp. AR92]